MFTCQITCKKPFPLNGSYYSPCSLPSGLLASSVQLDLISLPLHQHIHAHTHIRGPFLHPPLLTALPCVFTTRRQLFSTNGCVIVYDPIARGRFRRVAKSQGMRRRERKDKGYPQVFLVSCAPTSH